MSNEARRIPLFRSTVITVVVALLLLQAVIFSVSAYYILLPMVKRSTDDLAALMVLSTQTWAELPPQTRPDFELELARQHNLWLLDSSIDLSEYEHSIPYLMLLEQALETRTGKITRTRMTEFGKTWYWVEFNSGERNISIGFPKDRLGVQSPQAIALILLATVTLALLTSVILARRIVRPLQQLAEAAKHVGRGATPEKLPEGGVEELAELAHAFNTMADEVKSLLENRTTLLAGISHDLRTPLARMRIAIEMLPEEAAPKAVSRIKNDIEEMNRLIGEFIAFSKGLEKEQVQQTDINALLEALVENTIVEGGKIEWHAQKPCVKNIGQMALRRIISNLLSNAVRYGKGGAIELRCECQEKSMVIQVLDRGPGIPADEIENVFRPFYRLEASRSTVTGGSGLGLAIARQLAQVNGWSLELLPRDGGGVKAQLTLPDTN